METTGVKRHDQAGPVQPRRLRKLLKRMIDIYSPSGKEEELLAYLSSYLKRQGLPVMRQEVDDSRYNIVVHPPSGDACLCLVGHLDTVVAYDLDQYGYDTEEDRVTGLGAADMKGGCAAMIEAYMAAWETLSGRVPAALALVVGEEEDGDGAQRLVEEYHFPWAIIGEPTNLMPCLGHYGYLEIQLVTRGTRAHASLANRGKNPVEAMLRVLLALTSHIEKKRPRLVCNIRELYSSPAGFVVPDRCEVWIDVHMPHDAPVGAITVELEEVVAEEQKRNADLETSLSYSTINAGYDIPEKGTLVQVLKDVFRERSLPWSPQVFRSHSDAGILWEAGIKPLILGPGGIEQAHAPEESVSFEEVLRAAVLYRDCLVALSTRQV
ncbi:MAG: M20/M25/M40 family metallo-hydrolase [Deltaproteobacteria bacterium]|nr:M20/M25/M40 family metallo-hydrolase [Deltaproteobacteria bacterium]